MLVEDGQVFRLDEALFMSALPTQSARESNRGKPMFFPSEDGGLSLYQVWEAPVMAPKLSEKYPDIRSFRGYAVNAPEQRIFLSVSPKGMQAMVLGGGEKDDMAFLEKTSKGRYVYYSRGDRRAKDLAFVCKTMGDRYGKTIRKGQQARVVNDGLLRKFRLAVSALASIPNITGVPRTMPLRRSSLR